MQQQRQQNRLAMMCKISSPLVDIDSSCVHLQQFEVGLLVEDEESNFVNVYTIRYHVDVYKCRCAPPYSRRLS